ncbi:hypothetical protein [Pandoravirus japonicus]|uniref:Uncharacterized protein n=1 Tax=Pandoravirus japonicus TaxID=2823154 RepID=A0A811BN38_9VIRU|nr:hypothetical protein [Pandoravirus japonicus]
MNILYALAGVAPQVFCDALGRASSCEPGLRRAFVIGFCGCALLALWTANRHRNRLASSRKSGSGARRALDTVPDDLDDPIAPQTVPIGDQVQRHWTESMSQDSEPSTDTKENDIADDDDGDDGDGNDDDDDDDNKEDQIPSAVWVADAMPEARIDGRDSALLLDDNDDNDTDGGDNNPKGAVGQRCGQETTMVVQPPPSPLFDSDSAEILKDRKDNGCNGHAIVVGSGGRRVLCAHDALGRPDDTVVQEEASCGDGVLGVADGILARWSVQGLSVHASWAPAYADTHP